MGVAAGIALGQIGETGELPSFKYAVRDAKPAHVRFLRRRAVEQAEETPAKIVVGFRSFVSRCLFLQPLVSVERVKLALEFFRIGKLAAGFDHAVLRAKPRHRARPAPPRSWRHHSAPTRQRTPPHCCPPDVMSLRSAARSSGLRGSASALVRNHPALPLPLIISVSRLPSLRRYESIRRVRRLASAPRPWRRCAAYRLRKWRIR